MVRRFDVGRRAARPQRIGGTPSPPGLAPPAFDRDGRILAIFDDAGAVIYDFARRKPIEQVYAGFTTTMATAGFSGDSLYFVQPTTGPCNCDDFKGSDAAISIFRLGSRTVRRSAVMGDLNVPISMRQGKIATGNGLWDARTGSRLVRWHQGERVIGVVRLRQRAASILTSNTDTDQILLELASDTGERRRIMQLPELVANVSVRPQDDIVHFISGDPDALVLHRVNIDQARDNPVALPKRLCVNDGAVLAASECPPGGPLRKRQKLPKAAELPENLPVISPPIPQVSERTRPAGGRPFERDRD